MPKVLFLASQPFFQWRGSPIRIGFDVQALAESGYEVDLLVLPVGEDRPIPGVTIHRVPNLFGVRNVPIGPSLIKAAFDVPLLFKALWMAARNRYDVIHGVEDAGALGVVVAWLTRSRLIVEKHSDPSSYRGGGFKNLVMSLYARVEGFAARHADAVIGTGPGLVEQLKRLAPATPAFHIFDIPSSLTEPSPDKSAAVRAQLTAGHDRMLATFVGSFAVYQGVDLLFDAIPMAAAQRPNLHFVIIGGTADEIAARRVWLAARQVEDRVTFMGRLPPDDVPDVLHASDILLSPRVAGVNTPLKLLDYLKAARPIVATDTESNRLILDADSAVLVTPEPSALAAGICCLADDPELRARLGAGGRKRIDQTYNFEAFKKALCACYDHVMRP